MIVKRLSQFNYLQKNATLLGLLSMGMLFFIGSYFNSGLTSSGVSGGDDARTLGLGQHSNSANLGAVVQSGSFGSGFNGGASKGIMDNAHPSGIHPSNGGEEVDWSKVPPHLRGYYSQIVGAPQKQIHQQQQQVMNQQQQEEQISQQHEIAAAQAIQSIGNEAVEFKGPTIDFEEFQRQQDLEAALANGQALPPPQQRQQQPMHEVANNDQAEVAAKEEEMRQQHAEEEALRIAATAEEDARQKRESDIAAQREQQHQKQKQQREQEETALLQLEEVHKRQKEEAEAMRVREKEHKKLIEDERARLEKEKESQQQQQQQQHGVFEMTMPSEAEIEEAKKLAAQDALRLQEKQQQQLSEMMVSNESEAKVQRIQGDQQQQQQQQAKQANNSNNDNNGEAVLFPQLQSPELIAEAQERQIQAEEWMRNKAAAQNNNSNDKQHLRNDPDALLKEVNEKAAEVEQAQQAVFAGESLDIGSIAELQKELSELMAMMGGGDKGR